MKKLLFTILFINFAFANPLEFETLKSKFHQTVTAQNGDKSTQISYNGNFITTKTKAFWHYETPSLKDIYFSLESVIIIEPDLEQAIITTLKDTPNLVEILKNATPKGGEIYTAKFDGIEYELKFSGELIESITYIDKLDNFVEIKFSEVIKDSVVDERVFEVEIPKDFDIITQ